MIDYFFCALCLALSQDGPVISVVKFARQLPVTSSLLRGSWNDDRAAPVQKLSVALRHLFALLIGHVGGNGAAPRSAQMLGKAPYSQLLASRFKFNQDSSILSSTLQCLGSNIRSRVSFPIGRELKATAKIHDLVPLHLNMARKL